MSPFSATEMIWILMVVQTFGSQDSDYYRHRSADKEYSVFDANDDCQNHWYSGSKDYAYLASANSIQQYDSINAAAQMRNKSYWVGLILHQDISGNITYSWFDGTEVNTNIINSFWCQNGYPITFRNNLNHTHSVNVSYTYSDGTCWMNTFNTTNPIILGWICGPSFRQEFMCWITRCIFPFILLCIALIYCCLVTKSLISHLFIIDHNYATRPPSKAVKITAITFILFMSLSCFLGALAFLLYGIGYIKSGIVAPPDFPMSSYYDEVYRAAYTSAFGALMIVAFVPSAEYLHVLSRLYDVCDQNEIIRKIIPCRYWFHCMAFLILLFPIFIIIVEFKNSSDEISKTGPIPQIAILLFGLDLVIVNVSLSYYYAKGLHTYAHEHYFRVNIARQNLNTNMVDDRIHELMLEATRYVVLFGSVVLMDIAFVVSGVTMVIYGDSIYCQPVMILLEFIVMLKIFVCTQAIYLSFIFNHDKYLKQHRCGRCHEYVKDCCYKCVKRRQRRKLLQYGIDDEINKDVELIYAVGNDYLQML